MTMTPAEVRSEILDKRDRLPMWVIYHGASDVEAEWCARLWYTLPENECTERLIVADTFETLRELLPLREFGVFLDRNQEDDPVIVGSFML